MNAILSPIASEFTTQAQAVSHDQWFRAKVEQSLADNAPCVAHDEVMADVEAIIKAQEQAAQS